MRVLLRAFIEALIAWAALLVGHGFAGRYFGVIDSPVDHIDLYTGIALGYAAIRVVLAREE